MTQVNVEYKNKTEKMEIETGIIISFEYCGKRELYIVSKHPEEDFLLTCINDGAVWSSDSMTEREIAMLLEEKDGIIHKKVTIEVE